MAKYNPQQRHDYWVRKKARRSLLSEEEQEELRLKDNLASKKWRKNNPERSSALAKKHYENNPEKFIFYNCKRSAKERGLDFNLELSDIIIPEICPYLGTKLAKEYKKENKRNRRVAPSLDRIDNSKGYIKGNVEVISHLANSMKNSATKEELIAFAQAILKRFTYYF